MGAPCSKHVIRACQPLKAGAARSPSWAIRPKRSARLANSSGRADRVQQPQRGTGHAMQVARRAIRKSAKLAIVVPGDAPLLRTETLAALLDTHRRGEAAATILSAELADPAGYGRIVRDTEGRVQAIVEDKAPTPEQRAIREVNSSIYCFTLAKLWPCLEALRPENAHRELYLTDAIALLRQRNERVLAGDRARRRTKSWAAIRARTWPTRTACFARAKPAELMDAGVTIYLPETVVDRSGRHRRPGHGDRAGRAAARQDAHRRALQDPHRAAS